MRRTLILFSSLALIAAANAQSTSTASSSLIASYSLSGAASFDSYTSYEYDHVGTLSGTGFDDDGGKAIVTGSGGTTHSHVDGTNLFTMGSLTSAFIHSPDYSAIDAEADPYFESYMGYTYVLQFTVGSAGGSLRFDMHAVQSLTASASSPYGLQLYDANGDFSEGAYARGQAGAGVIDVTSSPYNVSQPSDRLLTVDSTSHEDTTLVPTSTYERLNSGTFSSTFTFGPAATATTHFFRFYTSTDSEVDFYKAAPQAVPEPASFAVLGLPALALLRRRSSSRRR